jgi:hypothetical protein
MVKETRTTMTDNPLILLRDACNDLHIVDGRLAHEQAPEALIALADKARLVAQALILYATRNIDLARATEDLGGTGATPVWHAVRAQLDEDYPLDVMRSACPHCCPTSVAERIPLV